MVCDCKQYEVAAGHDVCPSCEVELELSGGTWCIAYYERGRIERECEEMWREWEADKRVRDLEEEYHAVERSRRARRTMGQAIEAFGRPLKVKTWRPGGSR